MDHVSREQHIQATRAKPVEICSGILAGRIHLLEGSHALASLRWDVDVDERDPDFLTFAAISSETDALPIGDVRTHWAPEALARLEPEIESAITWASPQALPACCSVMQRFGA